MIQKRVSPIHGRQKAAEWLTYLLPKDGLSLTTVPTLLSVVSPLTCKRVRLSYQLTTTHTHTLTAGTLLTLSIEGILSLLVLGNFVGLVLLALLAVGSAGLGYVHLNGRIHDQLKKIKNKKNSWEQACGHRQYSERITSILLIAN